MKQVDLIRRYTLKKINEIRIFVSSLPEREDDALQKLYGTEGAKTYANIADFVLVQLGHIPPAVDLSSKHRQQSPTLRAALKVAPDEAAMPLRKERV